MKLTIGNLTSHGAAPPPTATTWDPANKSTGVDLSNGNLTGTNNGSGAASAKSTTSRAGAQVYFEITINSSFTGNSRMGMGTSAAPVTAIAGANAFSYGYQGSNGNLYNNTAVVGTAQSWTAGDTLRFAVDLINNLIWFSKVGSNWNGSGTANPATGVGGIAITGGTYFAMLSVSNSNDEGTANFGATAFVGAIPAGFSAWT